MLLATGAIHGGKVHIAVSHLHLPPGAYVTRILERAALFQSYRLAVRAGNGADSTGPVHMA